MQFSAAIIILTSVLAETSASTRRARRRAKDIITTDAKAAFSDSVINADSHSTDDPSDCKQQEEVTSIVHITAPAAEDLSLIHI